MRDLVRFARALWVLILVGALAGCFSPEEPLPPAEALQEAASRIDRILQDDRAFARSNPVEIPSETPADPSVVNLWYCAHPLMGPALGSPVRLAELNEGLGDTTLNAQFIGEWFYAVQKLTVSLAADDLPDIALVKRSWVARLARSGRIVPIDGMLAPEVLVDLRPEVHRAFGVDGRLYALPIDGFCSVLFYNSEVVKARPPATWNDLRTCANTLTWPEKEESQSRYLLGDLPFLPALWSAAGKVCDENRSRLTDPSSLEALEFLLALRNDGLLHPRALGDPEAGFALFLRGDVAMTVGSSAWLPRAETAGFPVGIAPIPGKSGPVSELSDNALVVFAKYAEAKRTAIARVLDLLTGPRIQGEHAVPLGAVPVRQSVAKQTTCPDGLDAAWRHAGSTPLIGPWSAIEAELRRYLERTYRWQGETVR